MRKEDLNEFLLTDIYKEIKTKLNIFKEDCKEELIGLNFDQNYSAIKAVKLQASIEAVNKVFDIIQNLKDEFDSIVQENIGGEE